jgi:hypothetical protein
MRMLDAISRKKTHRAVVGALFIFRNLPETAITIS